MAHPYPITTIQIPCATCKQPVDVEVSQQPNITNMLSCTIITIEHPTQAFCPRCNIAVVPAVVAISGLGIVAVPVPATSQRLILDPKNSGFKS